MDAHDQLILRVVRLLVGSSSGLSRKYFAQRPSRSSSRVRAWPDSLCDAKSAKGLGP
eukprot:COSAG01_NODE_3633_length_5845_cov_5.382701_6_plen_57_part_00